MNVTQFPFHILLDHLEKVVIVVDEDDTIIYINKMTKIKLGWDEKHYANLRFPELVGTLSTIHNRTKSATETPLYEAIIECADHTLLYLTFLKTDIQHENKHFSMFQECDKSISTTQTNNHDDYKGNILSAIPDFLFILNNQRKIVGYHVPSIESFEIHPIDIIGKTSDECFPAEAAACINEALDEADEKGYSTGKTYRISDKNKTEWFELSVNLNNSNNEVRYVALSRNITIPKQLEETLAENEVRFRSVIEQGEEGIVLVDETGRIIIWNSGQEKITGINRNEVIGRFLWDVLFQLGTEKRQSIPNALAQIKQRIINLLHKEDLQWMGQATENEIATTEGEVRIVSTTLFPVEFNDKYFLGAIHRDITEQKMAELVLRENEEYIRTLYYDSPVPVLVIEDDTLVVFDLNFAAVKAFGFNRREEIIGMHIEQLLPPENEEELYYNRQQIIEKIALFTNKSYNTFDCHFRVESGQIWDAKVHPFRISVKEKDLVQLTLIDTTAQNKAMHALFESESRYRAVAESANAGIGIVDVNEQFVYANETMADMLGYSRDELVGRSLLDFSTAETFNHFTEKTKQRHQGLTDQYEASMITKKGEIKSFSVSASSLFSSTDELIGTVGVMIDITEQKIASKKLIETSDQLQAIMTSMPDMIFIINKDGYYVDYFINQKLFPHTIYQPKKGQHLNDIFSKFEAEKISNAIQQSLELKETIVVQFDYELENQTNHFEARLSPMNDDKVLSVVRDITTLVTLESELIYNNELMRMLTMLATRFINLPIHQIESEIHHALSEIGSFASVDRVYIFDYNWTEDTMSNTYEWCSEGTSPEIDNLQKIPNSLLPDWVANHKKGEITYIPSVKSLDPGNNLRIILEPQGVLSLITIPLMKGNDCIGYVGFDSVKSERNFSDSELSLLRIFAELLTNLKIRQSTENLLLQNREILEKQNQQLLNLNERLRQQNEEIINKNTELDIERERAFTSDKLKTAFLNNVSHEVRTPLNGIIGFAQFLTDDSLTAEDKEEFVTALNVSVNRLTDTINDIMDVSLLMSGNMNYYPEAIDLSNLLHEVQKKNNFEAKSKNLELSIETLENNMNTKVVSDLSMLEKIFNELVGNAIKYTQKGFVRFGCHVQDNEIMLFVQDSGIGISQEVLPKIFEPFMQEDTSSTRKYEGSGLGLTIVRGLTELLKGKIIIESSAESGTKFTIKIPNQQVKPFKTKMTEPVIKNQKTHILIAEDESLNVLYIKRILKSSDFELLFALNGKEAVEMVQTHPEITLILMDIKMPVMDGLEATKIIRTFNSEIPIVAVTAYAANDDRHACFQAGCNEYVSKPFKADELMKLIDYYTNTDQDIQSPQKE